MARRQREDRPLLQTAVRGGIAGVIGGLAVTLVEREVLTRFVGGPQHRAAWDEVAARGLSGMGMKVGPRGRIAGGVLSQVLLAGALGATYAVLREETRRTRAGRILLDGALTYAASLVVPDQKPRRRGARRLSAKRSMVRAASPGAAFSGVTSLALGALTR